MLKKRHCHMLGLWLRPGANARGKYLREKKIFGLIGNNVRYQPRTIPLYPELIKLHNNIMVAAGVRFITHDASNTILRKLGMGRFPEHVGCIEVMDNVFIGYNVTILPDVRIGENVIIGASSTVTKDLEPNGVYAGSTAKKIKAFDEFVRNHAELPEGGFSYPYVEHNQRISESEIQLAWESFYCERKSVTTNNSLQ